MKIYSPGWSRRKFIISASLGGSAGVLQPWLAWAGDQEDPVVASIVAKTIGIDSHNHIDVPLDKNELPGPRLDLSGELKKSGLSAIVMTFATDYKRNIQPGEAYQRFLNGLFVMDKVLADSDMKRALTLADISAAHQKRTAIVLQSIEGCHFLEGKIERVAEAYQHGVRHIGLLHDSDASVPLGDVYTNPLQFGGLTKFGSQVINDANRLGMLVDLTHASNETINAALKISTKPIIVSHTGLDTQLGSNERMAEVMKPRLISANQAKIVADAGGVIGVWTHLSDTPLEYAKNIRAMVNVAGIDHVCIGTDTKLTMPYHSPSDGGGKPPKKSAGENPPGKSDTTKKDNKLQNGPPLRFRDRTNEAWDGQTSGFYYALVEALLKSGFNEDEIGKIGGGNYLRVFVAATNK